MSLDMDMEILESGLQVVAVGPFLILEMDKGKLDPAALAAETHVTILNANLDDADARQVAVGAQIVQQRWEAPPARECAYGTRTDCWLSTSSTAPAPTTSTIPAQHSADSNIPSLLPFAVMQGRAQLAYFDAVTGSMPYG